LLDEAVSQDNAAAEHHDVAADAVQEFLFREHGAVSEGEAADDDGGIEPEGLRGLHLHEGVNGLDAPGAEERIQHILGIAYVHDVAYRNGQNADFSATIDAYGVGARTLDCEGVVNDKPVHQGVEINRAVQSTGEGDGVSLS
jgi:hypothetical protein